jgi:hypothetical protein
MPTKWTKQIMIMRTIFILFSICFLTIQSFAQADDSYAENIRGKIIDAESQTPIPGANITLVDMDGKGSMSDFDGEFTIQNLPVGRYTIKASFLGYKPEIKRNIQVQSGKELYLIFELTEMVEKLDEVIVSAEHNKEQTINRMANVSARSFSIEETERYAGSLGDPARMAQNFAGVLSAGDQRNDIVIRGNSPTGLLWKLDGVPIPNPNHFGALGSTGGPVSMLNNNLLTNSDFFTGAFPAEYGNALSGVFDLNMRNGNNQNRQYVFQIGFNGFELGAEGPFSKSSQASYLMNYRYSTLAIMDLIGMGDTGGAVPQYQDLSFKLNIPTKKLGRFSLIGLGGISDIAFLQDDENDGSYDNMAGVNTRNGSDMGFISLNHLYFLSEKTRIESWVSASGYQVQTRVDSLEYTDSTQTEVLNDLLYYMEENREYKLQAGTKLSTKFNAKNFLDIGFSFQSTQVDYLDSVLNDIDSIGSSPVYTYQTNTDIHGDFLNLIQAYVQWKHKFTDKFHVYSGIHGQFLTLNKSNAIEPRISMEYQFAPRHSFSAGYGLHSQMQPGMTYFTQSVNESNGETIESNRDLDFTKSHQSVLAYNFVVSKNLRFRLESYYQYIYDIPARGNFSNINFGAGFSFPRFDSLSNIGNGRNYGLELTLEKFLSDNYYFLITASLFESEFKNPDTDWRNTAFNNQYVVNALGGVEIPIKDKLFLNINLRGLIAGGKPLLAIDLERSEEYNTTISDFAKGYNEKSPIYFRLDSRISLKVNGKKVSQEWALDLQNITDHKNVFSQTYYINEAGEADTRYNYQQGFFPMFLYRLNF